MSDVMPLTMCISTGRTVADLMGAPARTLLRPKFSQFWNFFAKSYVGAPWGISVPHGSAPVEVIS